HHGGRARYGRAAERPDAALRPGHRRDGGADAAGEHGAGHGLRRHRLLRRRVLRSPHADDGAGRPPAVGVRRRGGRHRVLREPRVTAIFTDISDSKRLEELHLRAERLEAVAELSASLAHEIKNPLASIRSSVEQLGRAKRAHPDEKFLTGLVVRESDRLSRLLSEFLDFSRVRATECRPLDLHAVAAAAIRLVRGIVERAVEAHRGLVLVDSTQGQGTTFTVYFPAARRKEEAAGRSSHPFWSSTTSWGSWTCSASS